MFFICVPFLLRGNRHSRAVVLKGGSNYYAQGSMWYFPNALPINQHEKMFLMNPGWERSGTVGFRCIADSVPLPPQTFETRSAF